MSANTPSTKVLFFVCVAALQPAVCIPTLEANRIVTVTPLQAFFFHVGKAHLRDIF